MTKHPQALKVVIADDETPARSRIRDLLEDCASSFPIELVGEAASGKELLAQLAKTPADVVLLDIRMPEMDGLEAAQHMLKLPEPPSVIFTTAYNDHALKAFELHAVDYLVKPIRLRRLHDALTRARGCPRAVTHGIHSEAVPPSSRWHKLPQPKGSFGRKREWFPVAFHLRHLQQCNGNAFLAKDSSRIDSQRLKALLRGWHSS